MDPSEVYYFFARIKKQRQYYRHFFCLKKLDKKTQQRGKRSSDWLVQLIVKEHTWLYVALWCQKTMNERGEDFHY